MSPPHAGTTRTVIAVTSRARAYLEDEDKKEVMLGEYMLHRTCENAAC
ncbi:hypothetical protein D187_001567 [Cystobacter fuscus DSM 2262]|uniref:Uncharacterized protein n=1 Tax=Cystobacter fuscus (strain ATCC 25194 / DSM 2262 / NBRC 100088 / M29) TaxID=1242864 RepID=S9P902_CYSF2|nr:hypothetical protein D187_001567 [Cystobacter fuscus DSM 2262]